MLSPSLLIPKVIESVYLQVHKKATAIRFRIINKDADKMKEIKRDNTLINYQVTGSGDTTLLFLQGSYIDQTYWKTLTI